MLRVDLRHKRPGRPRPAWVCWLAIVGLFALSAAADAIRWYVLLNAVQQ